MRERLPRQVRQVLARFGGVVPGWCGEYVFVVSYGRSGSTLLMGLLNAIPGYRIRGENYNTLYRLYQADAAVTKARDRFSSSDHLLEKSSWYGAPRIREHAYRAAPVGAFVDNVLRPEPGDRVIGYKEIRYTPLHMTDLAEYLAFLGEADDRHFHFYEAIDDSLDNIRELHRFLGEAFDEPAARAVLGTRFSPVDGQI